MGKDYYQILDLGRFASHYEIKSAYRRLASKYHPDVNKDPEASEYFIQIREAYDTLSSPDKKEIYDQKLRYQSLLDQGTIPKTNRRQKATQPPPRPPIFRKRRYTGGYYSTQGSYSKKDIDESYSRFKKALNYVNIIILIGGLLLMIDMLTKESSGTFYFTAIEEEITDEGSYFKIIKETYNVSVGPFKEISISHPGILYTSKIFHVRVGFKIMTDQGYVYIRDRAPVYGNLIFFPALALFCSCMAIIYYKKTTLMGNFSTSAIVFALITALALLMS
ncbi:J domain-containing protein [Marinigracilibium pacificum]|uniref:J domain-containing protein n=1 Tax=Marinigracilibium pacificum TaxID=2729599 RepID=A0A848J3Z0_9BACT|nr:DnaJ domain-containing protein [Marinigracilibium pacificum]NMM49069.1 J domain-containing protein [Marinigracilibium pacificum]